MNFGGLIFLLITQYITGRGMIALLKPQMNKLTEFCFSMLCGVGLFAFPPFIIQLLHIPITFTSILVGLLILTALCSIPLIPQIKMLFTLPKFKFKMPALYEYPFYIIFILLVLLSIWRCFYLPPNARDMTSGPELMADLAIKEKSMINSIFSIDLQSTNNYLKPPYITSLQIIYKLFVSPVGQLWLSITFVSFIVWIFSLLREKLHAMVACFALLSFFAMPELFGYTYLMLFDYSNMVFFCGGVFFLKQYFENKRVNDFAFATLLFTIATYIRTETPILLVLLIPIILYFMFKEKLPILKIGIRVAAFMIFPAIVYFLCMNVFVKHQIPITYDVSKDVNKNLSDFKPLFDRISDISGKLIFGDFGKNYYGYFIHVFCMIISIDFAMFIISKVTKTDSPYFSKFNTEAVTLLYGIVVVYFGLALIGFILPLADLMHTTKRGLFKLLPLMLLYYRDSGLLQKISSLIRNWETGSNDKPKVERVAPVAGRASQVAQKATVQKPPVISKKGRNG